MIGGRLKNDFGGMFKGWRYADFIELARVMSLRVGRRQQRMQIYS